MATRFYSGQTDYVDKLNELASASEISATVSNTLAPLVAQANSAAASAAVSSAAAASAWAASTAPTEQLAPISKSLHVGTVVKSIIYDTSKDSDGGAWRKRMQDKSWYNETLGGNAWIGQQPSEAVARAYVGSMASPNILSNGSFSTDTSGWTASFNSVLAMVSSELRVTTTDQSAPATQSFSTIVGRTYVLTGTLRIGSASAALIYAGTAAGNSSLASYSTASATNVTQTLTFVATGTTTFVGLQANGVGVTAFFDNISVKIVDTAIPTADYLYQSTADGKFYKTVSTSGVSEARRGISREFPAQVAIVAESLRVVIYDLTQASCPMWMVFVGGDVVQSGLLSFDQSTGSIANNIASIAALNGSLHLAQGNGGNGQGLRSINFITEFTDRVSDSARLNTWRFKGNISRRNNADGGYQYSSVGLAGLAANDVAITVLDTAPIDPATGLPVPTIAVATAGGVSVIKDNGTVVNDTYLLSSSLEANSIKFVGSGYVWASRIISAGQYFYYLKRNTIPATSTSSAPDAMYRSSVSTAGSPALALTGNGQVTGIERGAAATTTGLNLLKENPTTPAKGMVNYITNSYTSGWQVGDSRGAYLADTVAETVTASTQVSSTFTGTGVLDGWTLSATAVNNNGVNQLDITSGGTSDRLAEFVSSTVSGKTYTVTLTTVTYSSCHVYQINTSTLIGVTGAAGTYSFSFVAAGNNVLVILAGGGASERKAIDSIDVKLAEPDRSVKNKGLVINGSLTKTAVASGAGLVAYSGFSASNYLEQPYNSDLDFGTGDFCVMGWVNPANSTGNQRLLDKSDGTTTGQLGLYFSSGQLAVTVGVGGAFLTGGLVYPNASWSFVAVLRMSGQVYTYANGLLVNATSASQTVSNAASKTRVGLTYAGAEAFSGSVALWRITATAPTADQVAHIYRTELPLFQANAQCTLAGTSTSVTALAYDDVADELHVGTTWGRSEFRDLLRVASEATTTGAITSLSTNEGVVLTGGASSGKVYAPAMYLRDELRRKDVACKALGRLVIGQEFTATASQTVFTVRKGYDVKFVYVNGLLKRSVIDYNVTDDGFQETVTMLSGVPVGQAVTLMIVRG